MPQSRKLIYIQADYNRREFVQSIEQYGFTLLLLGKDKYANLDYLHIKNNTEKIYFCNSIYKHI